MRKRVRLSLQEYIDGILSGDRKILSRAITLIESTLSEDHELSTQLVDAILPHTGKARRIGITGVPGVGKSTFIEAFGSFLLETMDLKLAILTIDPSSSLTKGSILGDKTRMEKLSVHPGAFIRPSATGSALGGVANATREAMLLCEAAGFDIIIVETVGVGQSEIAVRNMVDFFLLLMLSGAGDELQGIKKGIMEMADALVINKADGDNILTAKKARAEYESALHLFPPGPKPWDPVVLMASSKKGEGIAEIWQCLEKYYKELSKTGYLAVLRRKQREEWFEEMIELLLLRNFYQRPDISREIEMAKTRVANSETTPLAAARKLIG